MAARARHLEYYVAFAEEAKLFGAEEVEWLRRLDVERENLLVAHAWCDRYPPGAEAGLRLASALKLYLFNRGMLGLAYRITMEALACAGVREHRAARCRSLFDAGQIAYFMGRYGEAVQSLEESLQAARELGDAQRIARALQPLGLACIARGDRAAAHRYLEEALALAKAQGDRRQVAGALNSLGQLRRVEGAPDAAEPIFREALALAREVADREAIAVMQLNLAMLSIYRSLYESARSMLLDTIAIVRETGSRPAGQSAIEVTAALAVQLGDLSRGARYYGAAEAVASETGVARDPADTAFLAPFVERLQTTLGPEAYATLESEGRGLRYEQALADANTWLAEPGVIDDRRRASASS
jgi:tetratricopeptide (TPR) repeat protein